MKRPSNENQVDVAIIGGGPVGLEVAWALGREGIEHVQFEAGQIGATMQWWAPGTTFFSSPERIQIAGVPLASPNQEKATREDYLAYLRQVAQTHELDVVTNTLVVRAAREGGGFVLETERSWRGVGGPGELCHAHDGRDARPTNSYRGSRTWRAKNIVLAIGNMHRAKLLGIEGEDLPFVSHYLADPHIYFRKRVLVVGGKNSAVEAAIRLYRAGAHVTLSYRGSEINKRVKYWLRPELKWLIEKGRIAFLPGTAPSQIDDNGAVHFSKTPTDQSSRVTSLVKDDGDRFDYVLLLTGYLQDDALFEQLGVERTGDDCKPVYDEATMQTNAPGVYVAGTACGGTPTKGVKVFIETSHDHGARIAASVAGKPAPKINEGAEVSLPES